MWNLTISGKGTRMNSPWTSSISMKSPTQLTARMTCMMHWWKPPSTLASIMATSSTVNMGTGLSSSGTCVCYCLTHSSGGCRWISTFPSRWHKSHLLLMFLVKKTSHCQANDTLTENSREMLPACSHVVLYFFPFIRIVGFSVTTVKTFLLPEWSVKLTQNYPITLEGVCTLIFQNWCPSLHV